MKAKFLNLNRRDFIKGLIVAVLTAVITFLTDALQKETTVDVELIKRVGITATIALLSYLIKNIFTNSKDEFLTPEK